MSNLNFTRLLLLSLLACCFAAVAHAAEATKVTLGDKGITVHGGTMGSFTLAYPSLADANQKAVHKLQEKRVEDKAATITYEGGGKLVITVGDGGDVKFAFSDMPDDVKSFG